MLRACIIGIVVYLSYIISIEALYCLSCADSTAPRHCHTIRKCSKGQVCYTESHLTENGVVVYDTGCTHAQTCQAKFRYMAAFRNLHGVDPSHHSLCVECCSTDSCNSHGCGQTGYPLTRGPICFNCPEVSDPMLCDKIKACQMDQVCHIRKEVEFGDNYYVSSCSDRRVCSSYSNIFGRRSLDDCSRCCHGDLCNDNCGGVTSSSTTMATTTTRTTATTASTTKEPKSTGSAGKEFLVLFMRNSPSVRGSLSIYITTSNTSTVNIASSPHLNANIKSAVDNNASITSESNFTLPFDLSCEYSKIEPKGVIIQTSQPSTVTIFDSFHQFANDATLVIPIFKLSNQYIISTTQPLDASDNYFSQFAIGTLRDHTNIKIKFRMVNNSSITLLGGTYSDGDVFSVSLDRLETFQVGHTTDLSGTFITSTEPIAVFSGNRCNRLFNSGCSHMVTQLPPTTELDHQFIVPPFLNNSKTLIQAIALAHDTINITVGGRTFSWVLNEREYKNMESTQTVVLVSRHPVLVTGFAMGHPTYPEIKPYMTVIPGVHQYMDYYKITVPAGYTENFLCIIIPALSTDNLQINGFFINYYNTVSRSSVYLDQAYNVRVFQVQNTGETFVLSTTDQSKFGLIVYGHRRIDGYGFAGNFLLP